MERLQAENAAEWGKRERLETEKISLERENKQLRSELRDLREERSESSRRSRPISQSSCDDAKQLQHELLERNKELVDLKHSSAKLKKLLADKTTELSHASRRSEQYEAEVKRIRARVDELKKELANAQDELDAANNGLRRLQRINDDLQEQLDAANALLEQSRNRYMPCAASCSVYIECKLSRALCFQCFGNSRPGRGGGNRGGEEPRRRAVGRRAPDRC